MQLPHSALTRGRGARRLAVILAATGAATAVHPAAGQAASVTLTPAAGPAGASVELHGSGFSRSTVVVVRRGRARLGRVRTGRDGAFRLHVQLPREVKGTVRLTTRARSATVANRFQVSETLGGRGVHERSTDSGHRVRWSPGVVAPGGVVSLRGAGFRAGRVVRASVEGQPETRARVGRRGAFALSLRVQGAPGQRAPLRVRSGRTNFRIPVTLASSGPSAPPGGPANSAPSASAPAPGSRRPAPVPAPAPAPAAPGDRQPGFPVRAAFYYPWQPETSWPAPGKRFTHYQPSLGAYDSGASALIRAHVHELEYAKVEVGISSWWGRGDRSDQRLPAILDETAALGSPLRWTVYYEPEGWKDPSVEEIRSDLTYLRDRYAKHPAFYRVGGKFVVFVWGIGSCADAARWKQANTVGAYVVLKLFGGYSTCPSQPDAWHEYSGAAQSPHLPDSFTVSPGFWQWNQAAPRLARDVNRFKGNVRNMVASNARFQLIVSFNEWGEGTATESASEWASPSGHGLYLDALHNDGR
jgi:Glycosyl hydrolase family 99